MNRMSKKWERIIDNIVKKAIKFQIVSAYEVLKPLHKKILKEGFYDKKVRTLYESGLKILREKYPNDDWLLKGWDLFSLLLETDNAYKVLVFEIYNDFSKMQKKRKVQ